jgi:citrate synthase
MSDSAKFELDGKTYEFPVETGSEGERGIDISKLRADSKFITLDNGLGNTGSCKSAITFLDGEKGILRYRGYSIEELAEHSTFLEVAYLLINNKLPSQNELTSFEEKVLGHKKLPEGLDKLIATYPQDAHPMGVLSSGISAMSCFNPELLDGDLSDEQKDTIIAQLLGQVKIMAANFFRRSQGKAFVAQNERKRYCSDFLNRMFDEELNPDVAHALDVLLILHADHEQNCSASTVRVVGSGKSNVYASIASGVNALWGPLHGGANQAVMEMLDAIKADGGDYKKFLGKAKDKNDPFRLMGFGHRVYKNFDPRAKIIKSACDTILSTLGVQDPLLDIAKGLEEAALTDPYFVERKLYPNVDFYSGIIYRALGIPTNMFTVMFALGRLPGWLAQWRELVESPTMRITRPRQIYTGENYREYKPIAKR